MRPRPKRALAVATLAITIAALATSFSIAAASPFVRRAASHSLPQAARPAVVPVQIEGVPLNGNWERMPPPTFTETSVAYDGSRQRLLLFGGSDDDTYTNDVWVLDLSGTPTWSVLPVSGTRPSARAAHCMMYDSARDRLLLFGGRDGGANTLNDLWQLDFTQNPPVWGQGSPTGTPPATRAYASAIYDSGEDRVIFFGGAHAVTDSGPPEDLLNDVWALPLNAPPAWIELAPTGTPPGARAGALVAYDATRDRMVMFGGFDGAMWNDCWELSLGASPQWSAMATTGGPPGERAVGAAIYDGPNDRLLIYGGIGGTGEDILTDAWSLALSSSVWSAVSPSGSQPSPREFPSGTYDAGNRRVIIYGGRASNDGQVADVACAMNLDGAPQWTHLGNSAPARTGGAGVYHGATNKLIVFGGENGGVASNDVWEFSMTTRRWTQWTPSGTPPSARAGHSAIYDALRNRMVVFGGHNGGSYYGDIWALTLGASPTWSQIIPTEPAGASVVAGGPPSPSARANHSAIYDWRRDRMIVYGGHNFGGSPMSDSWKLDLGSPHWTEIAINFGNPSPNSREKHSAVYDDRGDRMIVFGGQGAPNDVWQMPFPADAWSPLTASGTPGGRYGCAAAYDTSADAMLLFGGHFNGGGESNETWMLLLRGTPAWQPLNTAGARPRGRERAAVGYDQVGARLVLFAGNEWNGGLADTWVLDFDRATPVLGALVRATARLDRVELAWALPEAMTGVKIERRGPSTDWQTVATRDADGSGRIEFVDAAVAAGARYGYRLSDRDGNPLVREEWIDVPSGARIELAGFVPNPARTGARIAFTLGGSGRARVEVVDLAGRRVFEREVGSLGAGRHVLPIGEGVLAPGVYQVRLVTEDGLAVARRAVVLR